MLTCWQSAYNSVEDRVHLLESISPSHIKRIAKLEEFVRPFENYDRKTREALSDLSDLKKKFQILESGTSSHRKLEKKLQIFADETTKRIDSLSNSINESHPADLHQIEKRLQAFEADITKKTDSINKALAESAASLSKRISDLQAVDDHHQADINASVQTLLARVLRLESQAQTTTSTSAQELSTNDLANALIVRLVKGQSIDKEILVCLREVLPAPTPDQQRTDPTAIVAFDVPFDPALSSSEEATSRTEPVSSQKRKRSIEQPSADHGGNDIASKETPRLRKRSRLAGKLKSRSRNVVTNSAPTVQANGGPTADLPGQSIDDADVNTTTNLGETTVRRSTRTPKPSRKQESFIT